MSSGSDLGYQAVRTNVIILAAGASSRMGHPKALTMLDGEAALARIVRLAKGARCVVVLGEHHDIVRAAHPGLAVEWVHNRAPDAGRTGSLQWGLAHTRAERVLVWPVDHPLARAETIAILLATRGEWIVPTFKGRGGHPIVLGPAGIAAVRAAAPDAPLRDVLRDAGIAVTRVAVDDAGVVANLDTPEDLR